MNEASQRAFDSYLVELSQRGGSLSALVLNNCSVTGYGAGRIFSAMAGLHNVRLYLNGNPLEQGIEHLIQSIGLCWRGSFSLHLDMIEFRDESNYIGLVKALAVNKHIKHLSLVGTAPTPTDAATCSDQMWEALEHFLVTNQAVRLVDLSGYSGKLDEGQLGRGVGRALGGLARNRTVTHLRMRSQHLHENICTLGAALCENSTFRFLDCEDNDLILSSLRYLVKSVEKNKAMFDMPLGREEQERILARCLRDVPQPARSKKKGAAEAAAEAQKAMLRSEIEKGVAELRAYLARNRAALEAETGYVVDFDDSDEAGGWPSLDLKMPDGATPTDAIQAAAQERVTVRSSSASADTSAQTSYRVSQDDDILIDSPESATTPSSELPVTPELDEKGAVPRLVRSCEPRGHVK